MKMLPVFLLAVFSLDIGWTIFLFCLLCEILNHRRDSWALGFQYILLISPIRCLLGEVARMLWAQGQLHCAASYGLLASEMTKENQSMRRVRGCALGWVPRKQTCACGSLLGLLSRSTPLGGLHSAGGQRSEIKVLARLVSSLSLTYRWPSPPCVFTGSWHGAYLASVS